MQIRKSVPKVGKQAQQDRGRYLNSSNIVQGVPVSSTNSSSKRFQSSGKNQSQAFQPIKALHQQKLVAQPTQTYTKKVNAKHQDNGQHGYYQLRFVRKYFFFSLLHFLFFVALIFLQHYLYGYALTFGALISGYFSLLFAILQVRRASRKNKIGSIYVSQVSLALFLALQITGFVAAIVFPVRYSQNSVHNDAINDYNDYNSASVNDGNDDNFVTNRVLIPAYSIEDICQILKTQLGEGFSSKSYAQYCTDILNGKTSESQSYSSMQIGILIYHIAGLLAALLLTVVLGKMAYKYGQYIDTNGVPESPSSEE